MNVIIGIMTVCSFLLMVLSTQFQTEAVTTIAHFLNPIFANVVDHIITRSEDPVRRIERDVQKQQDQLLTTGMEGFTEKIHVLTMDEQNSTVKNGSFLWKRSKRDVDKPNTPSLGIIGSNDTIFIDENVPKNDSIFYLVASSNIEDPVVDVEIVNLTPNLPFSIKIDNRTHVRISLDKPLDYESATHHELLIRVTNGINKTAEKNLTINVRDLNDNKPEFEKGEGEVSTNAPVGYEVMKVVATDKDISPQYNNITYQIQDHEDLFTIGNTTGIVTLVRAITDSDIASTESEKSININIKATDNASNGNNEYGPHNSSVEKFRILIKREVTNNSNSDQSVTPQTDVTDSRETTNITTTTTTTITTANPKEVDNPSLDRITTSSPSEQSNTSQMPISSSEEKTNKAPFDRKKCARSKCRTPSSYPYYPSRSHSFIRSIWRF